MITKGTLILSKHARGRDPCRRRTGGSILKDGSKVKTFLVIITSQGSADNTKSPHKDLLVCLEPLLRGLGPTDPGSLVQALQVRVCVLFEQADNDDEL